MILIKWKLLVDIKNNIQSWKFWAGILFAQFLIFYLFSKIHFFINFFETFFEIKKYIHQLLFSAISFSIGDLFYSLLIFYFIFIIIKLFKKKSRGYYLKKLFVGLNILYFVYQIFWGMLYFQKPLIEFLPKKEFIETEIEALAIKYIYLTNQSRKNVHENKEGVFEITNISKIKSDILNAQQLIPKKISNKHPKTIKNIKPSIYNIFQNYTGILGYYNPFSAEAQYNPNLPSSYIPFTIAHESAHQLGFAREQEASFVGYLISLHSKNTDIIYSKNLYVAKSLLHFLKDKNPEFVGQASLFLSPEVKKDLENEKLFRQKYDSQLSAAFYWFNDLFLKSNQQEGSVTYSYFIDLLIKYEYLTNKNRNY